MRVLLSAYACEPGKGSEPEVGYRALLAAADRHEVWVLTRENNIRALEAALGEGGLAERVHLIGIDTLGLTRRLKRYLGAVGIQLYYRSWQQRASTEALRLDNEIDFDLVHHVTFSTYWAPIGVAAVCKPLVAGPLGGGVRPPLTLMPELGAAGAVTDGARLTFREIAWWIAGSQHALHEAAVVLLQNPETGAALGARSNTTQFTNALFVDLGPLEPTTRPRSKTVVSTGRLIPLKGGVTAVRALRYMQNEDAKLVFVGDGPQRRRIMRLANRLDVADRVEITGWLPRDEVIERVRSAGALVHPALHDEASWSVAEALSLGTPVVSYDHGGPPEVMKRWPEHLSIAVKASTPNESARRIARAVDSFLASPPPIPDATVSPDGRFSEALLKFYEMAAH